ncbi:MAG TPA: hypothetical protein V6D06_07660 [Trichocoleus sp.]
MRRSLWLGLGCWTVLWGLAQPGYALPGEAVRTVEAWIQGNPTLRPGPGEILVVNRTDTPAQRFSFQASIFPVSGVRAGVDGRIIRTERFSLFDLINSIDPVRMEEALRAIYGSEVYADYRRAVPLYSYPNVDSAPLANPELLLQGEVRANDRYAYWLELAADQAGTVYSGRMTIFLREDLPALLEQLNGQELP